MDISPSYNFLLGRPWIHIAGAVPSTLHQKIKFVTEGQLVCIATEENMIVGTSSGAPYVEADEFLKFIKHSEYSIVEQLHKLPAKIFLLALMMNSEPHREAVLKVLKQAYVPYNASIEKIDHLVGNLMMDNYISFSDDEIPPNGQGSTKALHITTKRKDCTLPKVLIDTSLP